MRDCSLFMSYERRVQHFKYSNVSVLYWQKAHQWTQLTQSKWSSCKVRGKNLVTRLPFFFSSVLDIIIWPSSCQLCGSASVNMHLAFMSMIRFFGCSRILWCIQFICSLPAYQEAGGRGGVSIRHCGFHGNYIEGILIHYKMLHFNSQDGRWMHANW